MMRAVVLLCFMSEVRGGVAEADATALLQQKGDSHGRGGERFPWLMPGYDLMQNALNAQKNHHDDDKHESTTPEGNLVLMHIPYNFGHTIEQVALMPLFSRDMVHGMQQAFLKKSKTDGVEVSQDRLDLMNMMKRHDGVAWGHFNQDLQDIDPKTGCPMYFTPPKYWPTKLAQKYFANKTIFGVLRDPYERIVSQFRGNVEGYGGFDDGAHERCSLNVGVKEMLKKYIAGGDKVKFDQECSFLPQAEYFDGEYGIKLPIDNRKFPHSMNKVFKDNNYGDAFQIRQKDILHVMECENLWAEDLDAEARALVRQVYKADFDLNCKHFGYCDFEENVCLQGVENMCPPKKFTWDSSDNLYFKKSDLSASAHNETKRFFGL